LKKAQLLRLATGDWIAQHGVLLITGPTGTGKSWLACALGHSACRHGYVVRYLRLPRLLPELAIARRVGTYGKVLAQLGKAELLVLDDWGLAPIGDRERRDLLEMIEDRTGRRATLLTSQVPVEHWHEGVGDATFGDAIVDRLVHQVDRITLTGGSLRKLATTSSAPATSKLVSTALTRARHASPQRKCPADMYRIGWPLWTGMRGRFEPDSVTALAGIRKVERPCVAKRSSRRAEFRFHIGAAGAFATASSAIEVLGHPRDNTEAGTADEHREQDANEGNHDERRIEPL
jgi:hypothetical protein